MSCTRYQPFFGAGGVLSAAYRSCGDLAPIILSVSGGVSGNPWNGGDGVGGMVVCSDSFPLTTYVGNMVSAAYVQGYQYDYPIRPWAEYTISNAVSAVSAHGI